VNTGSRIKSDIFINCDYSKLSMPNLRDWIEEQLKKGYSKRAIQSSLRTAGYAEDTVQEVKSLAEQNKMLHGTSLSTSKKPILILVVIIIAAVTALYVFDRIPVQTQQSAATEDVAPLQQQIAPLQRQVDPTPPTQPSQSPVEARGDLDEPLSDVRTRLPEEQPQLGGVDESVDEQVITLVDITNFTIMFETDGETLTMNIPGDVNVVEQLANGSLADANLIDIKPGNQVTIITEFAEGKNMLRAIILESA